jgi:hypothetical protein
MERRWTNATDKKERPHKGAKPYNTNFKRRKDYTMEDLKVPVEETERAAQLYAAFNEAERWAKRNKEYYRGHVKDALMQLYGECGADRIEITSEGQKIGSATLTMSDAHLIVTNQEAFNNFMLAHGLAYEVTYVEPEKDWGRHFRADGDVMVCTTVDADTGEVVEELCSFVKRVPRQPAYPTVHTTKDFKADVSGALDRAVKTSFDPLYGVEPTLLPALDVVRPQGGR